MNEFSSREKAFEKKFELDEEQKFKIASRSAHLFGMWVAAQLGLTGTDAESYAQQLVSGVTEKHGHAHLITKAEADLKAKGLSFSPHRLEKEFEALYASARNQIAGSGNT